MARRYLSGRWLIGVLAISLTFNFLTFTPALASWGRGGRFNGGVSTPTPTPSPTPTPTSTPTPVAGLDQYGGVTSVACPNGPQPHFYTQKIGDRWWLCDPAGNGFFMKGVTVIQYNVDSVQLILNETKYIPGPTSNWALNWSMEQAHRLLAWGFNSLADGAYGLMWPTSTDVQWGTSDNTIPVKLPFVYGENTTRYAFQNNAGCGAPSPLKDIMNGVSGTAYSGWRYNYGDYFDPNFSACVAGILQYTAGGATIHQVGTGMHNDYLLYATIDEGDQTGGLFAAGPNF